MYVQYIHTSHGFAVRHAWKSWLAERMRIRRSDGRGSVNHRTPTNHAKSQTENLICWGHRRCTSLGLSSSSCVARRLVAYKDELMWWDPSRSPYQPGRSGPDLEPPEMAALNPQWEGGASWNLLLSDGGSSMLPDTAQCLPTSQRPGIEPRCCITRQ